MVTLPPNATDADLLAVVRSWVDLLAAGEYAQAQALLVRVEEERDWPPERIAATVRRYTNHPAVYLRDFFGNPFRPVAFAPAWRTDTTVALARLMYEERDFSAMPILADALEEAGCTYPDLLGHLRGTGPHVRGCWAVDLVLARAAESSGQEDAAGWGSVEVGDEKQAVESKGECGADPLKRPWWRFW
jgi:hypothetical protein